MKVLAFAATSSRQSINKQLVAYAGSVFSSDVVADASVNLIDLNDFEMPIYSSDREQESGIPQLAHDFAAQVKDADAIFVAYAEHNGSYTAAFKNVFDWVSRIDQKVYQGKPMLLLASSPGPGGAASVLSAATQSAPYFAGEVKATLSVASFYDNFDMEQGKLTNDELNAQLFTALTALK